MTMALRLTLSTSRQTSTPWDRAIRMDREKIQERAEVVKEHDQGYPTGR